MRKLACPLVLVMALLAGCHNFLFHHDGTEAVPGTSGHKAFWTGKEMIVAGCCHLLFYDPAADTWRGTRFHSSSNREGYSAVWTGSQLIIWGGRVLPQNQWSEAIPTTGEGLRYDPALDSFVPISGLGAPEPRMDHSAVWTGTEMLVWGGRRSVSDLDSLNSGGRYDPQTDQWRPLSTEKAPSSRSRHAAVWTGGEMLVWGGEGQQGQERSGGRYDPATDQWSAISTTNAPAPRRYPGAVWDGSGLIIGGGQTSSTTDAAGARYDAASDSWKALANPPILTNGAAALNAEQWFPAMVWADHQLFLWISSGGARYDPTSDEWESLSPSGPGLHVPPVGHIGMSGIWTESEVIFWGGRPSSGGNNSDWCTGLRYNPSTKSWRPTSVSMPALDHDGD